MEKIYRLNDICFLIDGDIGPLSEYIGRFTYFEELPGCVENSITVHWSEDYAQAPPIPADAEVVFSTGLILSSGEELPYTSHRLGDVGWKHAHSFALARLDYEHNTLYVWRNRNYPFDMDTFVMLFAAQAASLMMRFGCFRLHSACAVVGGRGVLITGLSGRGKSTAAYAMLAAGHTVITDETAIIRRTGNGFACFSLLNTAKIGENSLNTFFSRLPLEFHRLGSEYYTRLPALFPEAFDGAGRIDAVLTLMQTGLETTEINPTSAMAVMPELLPVSLDISNDSNMEAAFSAVSELLDGAVTAKVLFGTDMAGFAGAVEAFMAGI